MNISALKARGAIFAVPRLVSLNYFYIAPVICPIVAATVSRYKEWEIDGS